MNQTNRRLAARFLVMAREMGSSTYRRRSGFLTRRAANRYATHLQAHGLGVRVREGR